MNELDPQRAVDYIQSGQWVAFSAFVIGLVIRLFKSDTRIPVTIPASWRPIAAAGLGFTSGVINHAATGSTWVEALLNGLLATMLAIFGHATLIEGVRQGKEIPLPWISKPVDDNDDDDDAV